MKQHDIVLSDAAENDLLNIYAWVHEAAGERVADRFYARLQQAAESLAYFPERGILRNSIAPGARLLVVGNYLILYHVKKAKVDVMRIVHGSVDLSSLPG